MTAVIERLATDSVDKTGESIHEKLGLTVKDLNKQLASRLQIKETSGVIGTGIRADGLALDSGINEGDVIKEIDGHKIENLNDYEKAVAAHKKGQFIRFLIKRGDNSLYLATRLD